MDLRQLRTLVAIADSGSFQHAAEVVALTPSAVSQQVQALESELGVALFDRATRPPSLNGHGLRFLDTARAMLRMADDAVETIRGRRIAGTLTLGAVRSSAFSLLPPALAALRVRIPGIRFRVRSARSDELLFDVLAGRLDAAMLPEHERLPEALRWRAFLREPLLVIAPPGTGPRSGAELLGREPYIRYKRNVPLAHLIDAEIARMGKRPQAVMEIDSMDGIVSCVAAGLGASVVPLLSLSDSADRQVLAVPFGEPQVRRRIGIVERRQHAHQELVGVLHEELARQAGRYGLHRTRASAVQDTG